jgi:proline iminopeptidase
MEDGAHFYDQRGSLRSPCPDSVLSVNDQLNDIERIRKSFRSERINLIGHSMGSWLAMAYLEKFPDHASKLILISSLNPRNAIPEEKKASASYNEAHFKRIYQSQDSLQPTVFKKFGLPNSPTKQDWQNMPQSKKFYINQFWAASGKITNYQNWEKDPTGSNFLFKSRVAEIIAPTMPRSYDFTLSIKNHSYPVIFIKADGDYLSPDILRKSIEGIATARMELISGAGHNMWLEQPRKFRDVMIKALKTTK